jgi:hypothetical protein
MRIAFINLILLSFLTTSLFAQNKIEVDFETGEDDLRGIGSTEAGPQLIIKLVNKPDVLKTGINALKTWPSNSIRRVSISLDTSIVIGDLLAMELSRRHLQSKNPSSQTPDNWDIKKVTVTATFKKNGQTTKYELLQTNNNINGMPYRMTYENSETPKRFDFNRNPTVLSGTNNWIDRVPPPQKATISATFGVGGDDLRGGNDNAKIVITFKNSTKKLMYDNINNRAKWENFTNHTVSKDLPSNKIPNLTVNDIATVELWHTGGGGMGADNWDLDKFKLTITINGQAKELVDKVGSPVHRFTGDTRKRVFVIE